MVCRNKYNNLIKSNRPISLICEICGKENKNEIGLAAHIGNAHIIKFRDYLVQYYLDGVKPSCAYEGCNKETQYRNGKDAGFYRFCPEHNHLGRTEWAKNNGFGALIDPKTNKGKTKETCESIKSASLKRKLKEETFNLYIKKIKKKFKIDLKYQEYMSAKQLITCFCKKCNSKHDSTFESFRRDNVRCFKCNPNGSNAEKDFIEEIMKKFDLSFEDVIRNSRNIIAPHEIDLFIPKYNIGIEYHGLYWHSYPNKTKTYHQEKALSALKNGKQLLQFFSDEVNLKKDILLSIIANKINKSEKYDARKMKIKKISAKEAGAFYEKTHLSGRGRLNDKYNYGLFLDDKLMSCLSLGKFVSVSGAMEIMRFSNELNCNVRGAFSRLLSFFIKDENYSGDIYSYCDLRIGNGSVYIANGFSLLKTTRPDYWYTNNKIREHRFKYRAQNGVSEASFAKMMNVSAIYGAGSYLFKKTV